MGVDGFQKNQIHSLQKFKAFQKNNFETKSTMVANAVGSHPTGKKSTIKMTHMIQIQIYQYQVTKINSWHHLHQNVPSQMVTKPSLSKLNFLEYLPKMSHWKLSTKFPKKLLLHQHHPNRLYCATVPPLKLLSPQRTVSFA